MTQARLRFETFEDYLSFDDGSNQMYELFHGELIELPPESGQNVGIANFLFVRFALIVGHLRVREHGLELEVRGEPKNRFPDLTILREEHIQQLQKRNTIRLFMAPPLLVVEVVSPGSENRQRDYIEKRSQYQDLAIPEVWLIDSSQEMVTLLSLSDQGYQEVGVFRGDDWVRSSLFPDLDLSAAQILKAGV